MKKRIAIFASGYGSNARAIMDACRKGNLLAEVVLVVSDKPEAHVHQFAKEYMVPSNTYLPKQYSSKQDFEKAILKKLRHDHIELIVLAGYMRLIGPTLLNAFENRIINIHPSLLPKYKGLDAIQQAMDAGDEETGVTVHFVDAGMDTGKIIAQKKLDKSIKGLSKEEVEQLVHEVEHELYVEVLKRMFDGV